VNQFLAAGTKHFGAVREGNSGGVVPVEVPTASFTAAVTGNSVSVDASGSTFDGGQIVGYAWYFGDTDETGEPTAVETGQQVDHVYSAPGTYVITMVAVGDNGSFGYTTRTVTVSDPNQPVIASADFQTVVNSGWDEADVGGPWTLTGPVEKFSQNGTFGGMQLEPSKSLRATLPGAPTAAGEVTVQTGYAQPITGGGVYVSVIPRIMADNSMYRAKVNIKPDGSASLALTRVNASGAETVIKNASAKLTGIALGQPIDIKVQAVGSSPTLLKAKMWLDGQPEPSAWNVEASDSTAGLQAAGATGLFAYQSGSGTSPVMMGFDNFVVKPVE
jgi:PKD domain